MSDKPNDQKRQVVPRKKLRASPAKQSEPGTVASSTEKEWRRQVRRHDRAVSVEAMDRWLESPCSYLGGVDPLTYIDPFEAIDLSKDTVSDITDEEISRLESEFDKRVSILEHARQVMLFASDPPKVDQWLCKPHADLNGVSPIGCIRDGNGQAVLDLVGNVLGSDSE